VAQPIITQPPANQVVALGGTLTLGVTAGGGAPAYQWFKDSRLVLGATNSTLMVMNAGVTNSGTYYVVVTNASGMIISLPALVAVGNPSLLAWGYNNEGQLGNCTTNDAHMPINIASNAVVGSAGGRHSLFVTADGTLWAMGYNNYGQLGIRSAISYTNLPVIVASNVVAAAAGYLHSLFVKTDGTLWTMGDNTYGQLGTTADIRPRNVASNVVAVAAGGWHSLFVTADGRLWAMGLNVYGQLGNAANIGYNNPNQTPINVASNVVAVAAGYEHSLFLKTDGTLWAMGRNDLGQLGNGRLSSGQPNSTPINVASNVVAVAAGYHHSLFMKMDGTLWAMGDNAFGQLGTISGSNPTPINVASNVVAVAAGYEDSLFVKTDGTLWAMGYNAYGELGNGTTSGSNPNPTPGSLPQLAVANVFPADIAFHSLAMGIIKASATVTLGNLNQLYTGSAINVTASTTPPGLTVNLIYNGSSNVPTNAGGYIVIGTINDPNYYGSTWNTLIVGLPPQSLTASTSSTNSQQLSLQLTGTPSYPYILQSATNLTPPIVWQSIFTNPADANGNWSFALTNLSGVPAGFYRAVAQ
jgi:alpha-tubulin suppressor-like RCC1 family protein